MAATFTFIKTPTVIEFPILTFYEAKERNNDDDDIFIGNQTALEALQRASAMLIVVEKAVRKTKF